MFNNLADTRYNLFNENNFRY